MWLISKVMSDIQKMQSLARDHSLRTFEENEKLILELDSKWKELDLRTKQLEKLVAECDAERREHDDEKRKNASISNLAHSITLEQEKLVERLLRFVEEQKRENEAATNKIIQLEKQLNAKQKLELEIQQMKGKLEVMEDYTGIKKMDEMSKEMKEKIEEMDDLEALNQTLVVKERLSNDELLEARKQLISGLRDMLSGRTIAIKRMGELDDTPFKTACELRFAKNEAHIKAAEFCSEW